MSKYNPDIHKRKSIRLKEYDYSQAGLYFITVCCQDKICRFGHIEHGKMILNECGLIAYNEWAKLPERYPNIELDVFQIMPNHIHGIIVIPVGATLAVAPVSGDSTVAPVSGDSTVAPDSEHSAITPDSTGGDETGGNENWARVNRAPTVGDIVGAYKSLVANGCLEIYKSKNEMMGKLWQRNYWEHIIRNDASRHRISEYIINNPAKWSDDKLHPD